MDDATTKQIVIDALESVIRDSEQQRAIYRLARIDYCGSLTVETQAKVEAALRLLEDNPKPGGAKP